MARTEYIKIPVPEPVEAAIRAEEVRSGQWRREVVAAFFEQCWPAWVDRRLRDDLAGTSVALDATSRPAAAAIGTGQDPRR